MQSVRVIVARRRDFAPGDAFEVFGNGGRGAIDFSRPLTPHPVAFWPDAVPTAGHLRDAHLCVFHLAAVHGADGHLLGTHLLDRHLRPERAMGFEAGRYCLGRFRFAVRVVDPSGNTRAEDVPEAEVVVNASPEPPCGFVPSASGAGGRMTFVFRGSLRMS